MRGQASGNTRGTAPIGLGRRIATRHTREEKGLAIDEDVFQDDGEEYDSGGDGSSPSSSEVPVVVARGRVAWIRRTSSLEELGEPRMLRRRIGRRIGREVVDVDEISGVAVAGEGYPEFDKCLHSPIGSRRNKKGRVATQNGQGDSSCDAIDILSDSNSPSPSVSYEFRRSTKPIFNREEPIIIDSDSADELEGSVEGSIVELGQESRAKESTRLFNVERSVEASENLEVEDLRSGRTRRPGKPRPEVIVTYGHSQRRLRDEGGEDGAKMERKTRAISVETDSGVSTNDEENDEERERGRISETIANSSSPAVALRSPSVPFEHLPLAVTPVAAKPISTSSTHSEGSVASSVSVPLPHRQTRGRASRTASSSIRSRDVGHARVRASPPPTRSSLGKKTPASILADAFNATASSSRHSPIVIADKVGSRTRSSGRKRNGLTCPRESPVVELVESPSEPLPRLRSGRLRTRSPLLTASRSNSRVGPSLRRSIGKEMDVVDPVCGTPKGIQRNKKIVEVFITRRISPRHLKPELPTGSDTFSANHEKPTTQRRGFPNARKPRRRQEQAQKKDVVDLTNSPKSESESESDAHTQEVEDSSFSRSVSVPVSTRMNRNLCLNEDGLEIVEHVSVSEVNAASAGSEERGVDQASEMGRDEESDVVQATTPEIMSDDGWEVGHVFPSLGLNTSQRGPVHQIDDSSSADEDADMQECEELCGGSEIARKGDLDSGPCQQDPVPNTVSQQPTLGTEMADVRATGCCSDSSLTPITSRDASSRGSPLSKRRYSAVETSSVSLVSSSDDLPFMPGIKTRSVRKLLPLRKQKGKKPMSPGSTPSRRSTSHSGLDTESESDKGGWNLMRRQFLDNGGRTVIASTSRVTLDVFSRSGSSVTESSSCESGPPSRSAVNPRMTNNAFVSLRRLSKEERAQYVVQPAERKRKRGRPRKVVRATQRRLDRAVNSSGSHVTQAQGDSVLMTPVLPVAVVDIPLSQEERQKLDSIAASLAATFSPTKASSAPIPAAMVEVLSSETTVVVTPSSAGEAQKGVCSDIVMEESPGLSSSATHKESFDVPVERSDERKAGSVTPTFLPKVVSDLPCPPNDTPPPLPPGPPPPPRFLFVNTFHPLSPLRRDEYITSLSPEYTPPLPPSDVPTNQRAASSLSSMEFSPPTPLIDDSFQQPPVNSPCPDASPPPVDPPSLSQAREIVSLDTPVDVEEHLDKGTEEGVSEYHADGSQGGDNASTKGTSVQLSTVRPGSISRASSRLSSLTSLSDMDITESAESTKAVATDITLPQEFVDRLVSKTAYCHQCRRQTKYAKMTCRQILPKPRAKRGKRSTLVCGMVYCHMCILKRYPDLEFNRRARDFKCPRCLDICNCTACCDKRGEMYKSTSRNFAPNTDVYVEEAIAGAEERYAKFGILPADGVGIEDEENDLELDYGPRLLPDGTVDLGVEANAWIKQKEMEHLHRVQDSVLSGTETSQDENTRPRTRSRRGTSAESNKNEHIASVAANKPRLRVFVGAWQLSWGAQPSAGSIDIMPGIDLPPLLRRGPGSMNGVQSSAGTSSQGSVPPSAVDDIENAQQGDEPLKTRYYVGSSAPLTQKYPSSEALQQKFRSGPPRQTKAKKSPAKEKVKEVARGVSVMAVATRSESSLSLETVSQDEDEVYLPVATRQSKRPHRPSARLLESDEAEPLRKRLKLDMVPEFTINHDDAAMSGPELDMVDGRDGSVSRGLAPINAFGQDVMLGSGCQVSPDRPREEIPGNVDRGAQCFVDDVIPPVSANTTGMFEAWPATCSDDGMGQATILEYESQKYTRNTPSDEMNMGSEPHRGFGYDFGIGMGGDGLGMDMGIGIDMGMNGMVIPDMDNSVSAAIGTFTKHGTEHYTDTSDPIVRSRGDSSATNSSSASSSEGRERKRLSYAETEIAIRRALAVWGKND